MRLNLKNEIIHRNGEKYLQINSMDSSSVRILGDFKLDMQLKSRVPKIVQNAINEQAKSCVKQLKPLIEIQFNEHLSEILYKAFTPVFANVAIKNLLL